MLVATAADVKKPDVCAVRLRAQERQLRPIKLVSKRRGSMTEVEETNSAEHASMTVIGRMRKRVRQEHCVARRRCSLQVSGRAHTLQVTQN